MADETQPPTSERRGLTDVQLSELVVRRLFGRYTHRIPLSTSSDDLATPSVVILYGSNGIGKTTILRMLDGLLRLDFDVFREVPFQSSRLSFSTGQQLDVWSQKDGLKVSFDDYTVILDPKLGSKGALRKSEAGKVEEFRSYFFKNVENISLNFITADRAERFRRPDPSGGLGLSFRDYHLLESGELPPSVRRQAELIRQRELMRQRDLADARPIADEVKRFIRDAQIDSGPFFLTNSKDIFSRILDDLTVQDVQPKSGKEIARMFELVHQQDLNLERLGLQGDRWDYGRISEILRQPESKQSAHTLTVLSTYANFLTSRAQARSLIAERLLTFEEVMNDFLEDKEVRVDASSGFVIYANGTPLAERQLSSGEIQLLYLMVAALTTRRRGTVIAIDEPELSMHIRWQKKLVSHLIRCASKAAPQFVLATHSPDISTPYSEYMVELTSVSEDS